MQKVQDTTTNTEKSKWPKCRECVSVETSVTKGTFMLQTLPQAITEEKTEIIRVIGSDKTVSSGHNGSTEIMNSQQLWQPDQDPHKIKPESLPAQTASFRVLGKLTLCLPVSALIIPMSWHLHLLQSLLQSQLRLHLHHWAALATRGLWLCRNYSLFAWLLQFWSIHAAKTRATWETPPQYHVQLPIWVQPLPASGSQLLCTTIGKHSQISQGCWSLNNYSWFPGPAKQHWSR